MNTRKLIFLGIIFITTNIYSQDPNFYIYLCFGQSNMEGQGPIEAIDRDVDSRFKLLQAVDCSNLGRTKGIWYNFIPPSSRCSKGLSPADYFGRFMIENLPDSITVGIINVSVGGCKIELYDKANYQDYVATVTESWLIDAINAYDGNPYGYLVDMAKLAQKDGVIKGLLLHQGESNTGDTQWPSKVKTVYDSLIVDLGLPDTIPLLAGEVVHADQGGGCASMNSIIAKLPETIPNSYIISSSGCTRSDVLHFNSAGYRKIGIRYAVQMLSLLGYEVVEPGTTTSPIGTEKVFLEPECGTSIGKDWEIITDSGASNGNYVMVKEGLGSLTEAPGEKGVISLPFSVDTTGEYNVYAHINCPTFDDDSYWIKMDDGDYWMVNGLWSRGWQWAKLQSYNLTAGEHVFYITYREDGAKLDKICISNYSTAPDSLGDEADNICKINNDTVGDTTSTVVNFKETVDNYSLGQNYPNPFYEKTFITFEVPNSTFVSIKLFNMLGEEVTRLAEEKFTQGKHTIEFIPGDLPKGNYLYSIETDKFFSTRKMIILVE